MFITGKGPHGLLTQAKQVQDKKLSVDRGYAWVILAISFFAHLVTMGLSFTVGIFYTLIDDNLEVNSHRLVALAPSIFHASFYGTGKYCPFSFTDKFFKATIFRFCICF